MSGAEVEALLLDVLDAELDKEGIPTPGERAAGRAEMRRAMSEKPIDFAGLGREFTREQLVEAFSAMAARRWS